MIPIFKPSDLRNDLPALRYACLASDAHPMYMEFVRPCSKAWADLGTEPVIALIGAEDRSYPGEYGTIHELKAHPTLPTWFQAQYARLYVMCFIDGVCHVNDIDMLPLDARYYALYASLVTDTNFVHAQCRLPERFPRYIFHALFGQSKTLCELLNIKGTFHEFLDFVVDRVGVDWNSDEAFLDTMLSTIPAERRVEHSRNAQPMIAPHRLYRDSHAFLREKYVDFHCPRPYAQHKEYIDRQFIEHATKVDGGFLHSKERYT